MTPATAGLIVSLGLLAGCTDDGGSTDRDPAATSTASPTAPKPVPSVDSSSKGAVAIRGDWHDPDAEWVVHFEEDGSFTEDFEGNPDFRQGTYEVEGDVVRLFGADGNTDEGRVLDGGTRLKFRLGTLTRQ